jgi:hypothetical protein
MQASTFSRTRAVLGLTLATLASGCGDDPQPKGALMLSITTDMAVPNDIDRLKWSITLDGETTPFATEMVELASGTDLPVTLAIKAGRNTQLPITVRVEGHKGGDSSSPPTITAPPKVAREARLRMPQDRVATLDLHLSWLCSPANLAEACEASTTCQAGHCVDAAVQTASLPEFQARPALECQDVTACLHDRVTFTAVGSHQLKSGKKVACGIVGATSLGPDADVTVLLVVNNDRAGNYGFCGLNNDCYIPLRRGETPESWRVIENGETPAIELPSAVCENSTKSVTQVAIVRSSAICPSAHGYRPLCSPEEKQGCLPVDEVCPSTSPKNDWVGYACTGAARPTDDHPDVAKCWSAPGLDSDVHTPNDGRLCCLKSKQSSDPLHDDPLLIDDMSAGPQVKLEPAPGHIAGWWFSDYPYGSGHLIPAPDPSLYTYREFKKPVGPPGDPKFSVAACLSSRGFRGWEAIQGFHFASKPGTAGQTVLDVGKYDGISFWGWAHEPLNAPRAVEVHFDNVQVSTEPSSECVSPAAICESYFKEVTLTSEWKRYFVRWADLGQSEDEWGQMRFDGFKPQIYNAYFSVRGAGPDFVSQPFEFCIADIRFEQAHESRK